jgi:hypothetical protein
VVGKIGRAGLTRQMENERKEFLFSAVRFQKVLMKQLKQPLQVVWTREDDLQHGFY